MTVHNYFEQAEKAETDAEKNEIFLKILENPKPNYGTVLKVQQLSPVGSEAEHIANQLAAEMSRSNRRRGDLIQGNTLEENKARA